LIGWMEDRGLTVAELRVERVDEFLADARHDYRRPTFLPSVAPSAPPVTTSTS